MWSPVAPMALCGHVRHRAAHRSRKWQPAVGRPLRSRAWRHPGLQDEIARRIMVELEPALTKADFSVIRRRRIDGIDGRISGLAAGAIAAHGFNEHSIAEATSVAWAIAIVLTSR